MLDNYIYKIHIYNGTFEEIAFGTYWHRIIDKQRGHHNWPSRDSIKNAHFFFI